MLTLVLSYYTNCGLIELITSWITINLKNKTIILIIKFYTTFTYNLIILQIGLL
jgi:hypothetical protein